MALLRDEDVQVLTESFAGLVDEVRLTVVTREKSRLVLPGAEEPEEDSSAEVKQLLGEVAETSPKIALDLLDAAAEPERARELVGERLPAIAFSSPRSRGTLRYVGLPAGYEMSTVVAAIHDLGDAESPLPPEVQTRLFAIDQPIHIQVFVTPS